MPFGLSGAPATFQRMMVQNLCQVYLDDIVIYSCNWMEHLQKVLERLQQAGHTLKLKICDFGATEYTYLGHRVGRN